MSLCLLQLPIAAAVPGPSPCPLAYGVFVHIICQSTDVANAPGAMRRSTVILCIPFTFPT